MTIGEKIDQFNTAVQEKVGQAAQKLKEYQKEQEQKAKEEKESKEKAEHKQSFHESMKGAAEKVVPDQNC